MALDAVTIHTNTAVCTSSVRASSLGQGLGGKRRGKKGNDNVGEVKKEGRLEEHIAPGGIRLRTLAQTQN